MNVSSIELTHDVTAQLEPLSIRGHHARYLQPVVSQGVEPSVAASSFELGREGSRYGRDVLGWTGVQALRARRGIERSIRDFVDLPDDVPVRFVKGLKDGFCNSCIIGRHCDELGVDADDLDVMRAIGRVAQKQNEDVAWGKVEIPGYRVPMPYIELTARAARLVLAYPGFLAEANPWFVRPFAKAWYRLRAAAS